MDKQTPHLPTFHQVWSAWRICWACKSRSCCEEIHLHPVLCGFLSACFGSNCPGSHDKSSSARRPFIPPLLSGELALSGSSVAKNAMLFSIVYCIYGVIWGSYESFSMQETQHIRSTVVKNVKKACEVINSLQGFSCQAVEGGAFAFPRIHLPAKAIQKAKVTEWLRRNRRNM